jgi:2-octaprenyl-6-methoxyphenol hydroxylase
MSGARAATRRRHLRRRPGRHGAGLPAGAARHGPGRIALIDAKSLGAGAGRSALDRAVLGQPPAARGHRRLAAAGHADPPDPRLAPRPFRPQHDRPREHKLPALGYVTRYGELVSALAAACERAGVHVLRPARVTASSVEHADGVMLQLDDGATLTAKLAVQAEGGVFGEQEARPRGATTSRAR